MARLDRLGRAKEMAQVGAAIGRQFTHTLIASVVRKSEVERGSTLDRLIQAGCVPPQATYLFKHELVQEVAYGTLLREPRRALHARISAVFRCWAPECWRKRERTLIKASRFTILPSIVFWRHDLAWTQGCQSCPTDHGCYGYSATQCPRSRMLRLKHAREIGHAAVLMYALGHVSFTCMWEGNYATGGARIEELVALADKKSADQWKAFAMLSQRWLFSVSGKAADAVQCQRGSQDAVID